MHRRDVLTGFSKALAALLPLSGSHALRRWEDSWQKLAERLAGASDSQWPQVVRNEFMLEEGIVHLNCGSIGATPTIVVDAINQATRQLEASPVYHQFGQGIYSGIDQIRVAGSRYFGVDVEEICITGNTTLAMNAVSRGLGLERGDEVIVTNREHPGGMLCWQHLAKQEGVVLRFLELDREIPDSQSIVDRVKAMVNGRTRVFSFSHIDTMTGLRLPVEQLARVAREHSIFFLCDGAQAAGMFSVHPQQLGVDAYACSGHKWMLGPKGTGWLYVRKSSQPRCRTLELSDFRVYSASRGTVNLPSVIGQLASIQFLEMVGQDRIALRIRKLASHLRDRLAELSGFRVLTPTEPDRNGGIVTVAIDRKLANSHELARDLERRHKIFVRPVQSTYAAVEFDGVTHEDYNAIRFSTHIFNRSSELDRVVDVLAKL